MKMFKIIMVSAIALFSISCQSKSKDQKPQLDGVVYSAQDLKGYETAYFASGCFWCVEAVFESVKGVKEVISGYAGGTELNPTYEQVGMGKTSHAEAVEVYYDPKVVSYATLVKVFFGSQDPTTLNRQGPDRGAQYRSVAFYKNEGEKKIIVDYIAKLTKDKVFSSPIVTEVTPFTKFYDAEDYHQDYERKHPNNPYIQGVSVPRLKRFQKKFPELLKTDAH
ncbi:MAG: peptide-methionine (S)-S-oxide reductase [Psychroserpens sp.]|jgi:peptide-methionine (S)-S-oxide reductase